MYRNKNKNKGVKISLIVALLAALLGCLIAFASNPFGVSKEALSESEHISAPTREANATAETVETNSGIAPHSPDTLAMEWSAAAANSGGAPGTFILTEDWTASSGSIGFGNGGSNFMNGGLYVPANRTVTIDLNGHKLDRNKPTDDSSVITVEGTLIINDSVGGGIITGGQGSYYYSGIKVDGGNLTLNGGTITGNYTKGGGGTTIGGGVGVYNGGTFTMNGGTISGNEAFLGQGGGVGVSDGTFNMYGGTISGNTASRGGAGVFVGDGTFNMYGGVITGNSCENPGGGIYLNNRNSKFYMYDGTISDNNSETANGANIYANYSSTFEMRGGEVSGNAHNYSVYMNCAYINLYSGTIRTDSAKDTLMCYRAYVQIMGGTIAGGANTETCVEATMCESFSMSAGTITGGKFGLYVYDGRPAALSGGTITGCTYGFVLTSMASTTSLGIDISDNKVANFAVKGTSSDNWSYAVNYSLTNHEAVGFIVWGNMTASTSGSSTSFGTGAAFDNGMLLVPYGANIVLDLNGSTLDRGLASKSAVANGSVICVDRSTLTVVDTSSDGNGKITGGNTTGNGGGITSKEGSGTSNQIVIKGGAITGNKAANGGGVYMADFTAFEMSGGEISYNTATSEGGGIYNDSSYTSCEITGGKITHNTAGVEGGGLSVSVINDFSGSAEISYNTVTGTGKGSGISGYIVKISGGKIFNNSGANCNAAVYVTAGQCELYGGEIFNNSTTNGTVAGVFSENEPKVQGSVKIYDNTKSGNQSNLYLSIGQTISLQGELNSARIGVTLAAGTGKVASNFTRYGNVASDVTLFFFSDAGKTIGFSSDNVVITSTTAPTQTALTWQYRKDGGDWITVSGSNLSVEYCGAAYFIRALNTSGSAVSLTIKLNNLTQYDMKDVGAYSIKLRNSSDYDKYINPTFNFEVTPLKVSVSWSNDALRYNGTMQYPKPIITGLIYGDELSVSLDTSLAGTNAGKGYKVTVTGLEGADADNYQLSSDKTYSTVYSILRAQLEKPVATGSNEFVYNGEERTFTVPVVTGLTLSSNTGTNAGKYTAVISLDTTNYEWSNGTTSNVKYTWRILPKEIYVSGISVENKPYDGNTSATVDMSGVKLSGVIDADKTKIGLEFDSTTEFDGYTIGWHDVAITGVQLTGEAAGNYYLNADEVSGRAKIYAATITISGVVANNKTYDGTTAVTFNYDSVVITGAVSTEVANLIAHLSVEGYFDNKNVNDTVGVTVKKYILDGDYADNYEINFADSDQTLSAAITPAEVEVTLGANEYTITYGNALKITYSQNSPVKSESVILALEYYDEYGITKLSGVPTDAGDYVVKVVVDPTDTNAANYIVKNTGAGIISEATVKIEKATLTVRVEGLEIEYGSAKPADSDYTLIYSGWLNGDATSVTPTVTVGTDYVPGNDVNDYTLTLTAETLTNYNIVVADDTLNGKLHVVPKKVIVRIDDKTNTYGEVDVELTSDGTAEMDITLTRESGTNVGKYIISGSSTNGNYDITFVTGIYEITPATLIVTANGNTITYGEEASHDGVSYDGFVNGDDESVLKGDLKYRYTYTQYGNIYEDGTADEIEYYIIPRGLTADNYYIVFETGLLKVEQKAATVKVHNVDGDITNTPADRTEAAKNVKYEVTGTVNGDDLIVAISIAEAGIHKEDGSPVTTSVTWCAVGSYDITATFNNPNYIVTFEYDGGATKGTYKIAKGTLTITANTLIISYGNEASFAGLDLDEVLSVEGLPAGTTLADVHGKSIFGSIAVLPYGDAKYDEYAAMGSAYQLGDDIYDASGNRISYIIIPTGLVSSSYSITFKPGKLIVEPKSITVTLDDKSSVYGEELKELTASATGLVNYDEAVNGSVVEFLGITGLAKAAGTDAHDYPITATGSTNKNYRVTFVNGVYTIEKYEVTVVWVSGNDDEPDKFEYEYNGSAFSPVATFEMHGKTYKSTDPEAERLIEIIGSGVNADNYKAQAYLLDDNLKFSTASTNEITKDFTVKTKQLTVKWYKTKDDIGKTDKVLDTNDVVTYNYRVGDPWAPVAVVEGVADVDKSIVSIEVSGKQNSVNKGNPYVAELWIHGSNNYSVAGSDKTIEFAIVMVAPGDFKWIGETSYVYNGEAQQPVAESSNNPHFIYVVELLDDDGAVLKTVPTAISVGKYRITAEPKDVNFLIPDDKKSYEFEITPCEVQVVWSATSFEYNGAKQVPTAYYKDVYDQHVELEVTLADGEDGIKGGNEYHVSVTLNSTNYTFKDGTDLVATLEATYTITTKNIVVTWTSGYVEDGGNYKWVAEYKNADESESVNFVAAMSNDVEPVALDVKVYWQANAGDEPVEVSKVHDAGIYTWRVALADKNGAINSNYSVVNAERSFEITRPTLTVKAANKTVNTGAAVQSLTATFDGFVDGETEESLGLVKDGKYAWLDTNYTRNSVYLDASAYDTPAYEDLQTLADLNGIKGYFVVLTDSEVKLNALGELLKNYDWSFEYGKVIIIAVDGDVRIITEKEYNGENQKPSAQYKNAAGNWTDLNVVVYNEDYSEIIENAEVKNVGTYYLLLSKHDDDNTPLAGAEPEGNQYAGCVKKTFTITKRQIEVKISDNSVSYGTATRGNYAEYLNWAYANEDPNHKPLTGDDLEIVLNLELTTGSFDGGDYLNAGVYGIVAGWNEGMTNYEVRFIGSDGDKGVFEVSLAKVSLEEWGEYNQVIEEDGRLTMSLGEMTDDGSAYVNFSFTGYQNTDLVQIYYSNPYSLDQNDPNDHKPDTDVTVVQTASPVFVRLGSDTRYFVNFKIVVPNHEPYYGQWKALILVDTIYIRILFVDGKTYDVVYGDAIPDGKTLATELWDNGYIDKLSTGIQNKFRDYIENGLVTAKVVTDGADDLARGSYSIIFEGFENVEDGKYQVTYKENITDPDSKATNIGKYVVNRRDLTITWDKTTFVYDGEAHLPVPEITGWTRAEGTQTVNGATVYTFTNAELGKSLTLTVRTNGGDFTSIGSENVVIATVDDDNYALDSLNATRAVSIIGETPVPVDPSDPIEPNDPIAPIVKESGIPAWALWLLGIVAVLALLVIIILATKSKKTKSVGDDDGFYDDVDENS